MAIRCPSGVHAAGPASRTLAGNGIRQRTTPLPSSIINSESSVVTTANRASGENAAAAADAGATGTGRTCTSPVAGS